MTSNPNKNPLFNYARYSSVAIQMAVIIAAGVFGGYKLDGFLNTTPLFTIIFSVAGVAIAIYLSIKDVLKPKQKK
jgi:F0F1-type ATP synthase assembly protein I